MIKLRPYQQRLVADIERAWWAVDRVLAVCPTGSGKTIMLADIVHRHAGASVVIVHRREILAQISVSLAKLEVKHRVIAPPSTVALIRRRHLREIGRSYVDPHAQCGVGSVQTLTSKATLNNTALQRWASCITLGVLDEGHHYVRAGSWAKAVDMLGAAKLLMVTATPQRADGKGLGAHAHGYADIMVEGPTTGRLIANGYLSPFKYYAPSTDLDVSGLTVTGGGDFNAKALRERVVESHLVGDVVAHWGKFTPNTQTIVFATDVSTAEEIAGAFVCAGVPAVALSGATAQLDRERELARFECGETRVLVNAELFGEGLDIASIQTVLLARPTESLAVYLQQCGRALRILDGKPSAYIVDMVRNWERMGLPNWPRQWTLDARERGQRSAPSDTIPQRVCLTCTQPYERFHPACPWCGAVPEPGGRSSPEQVDGDLQELDVEALAALFAAIDRADMSDDEYAADQLARHIPAVGRGADMKRHRAGKYRRAILRELVAWWVGSQPDGRTLSEKHRRFFHRFGTDIGTAFTLNAADTDALIGRITDRYSEDMV